MDMHINGLLGNINTSKRLKRHKNWVKVKQVLRRLKLLKDPGSKILFGHLTTYPQPTKDSYRQ
jgi:hypothetical protein